MENSTIVDGYSIVFNIFLLLITILFFKLKSIQMAATFEYWLSSSDSQYWFHLKENGNSEIILSSTEGYTNEQNCLNGIASTKRNAPLDSNYNRITGNDGRYYFTLRAGNYEPVSRSQGYSSSYSRDRGIENCKAEAPGAPVKKI